MPITYTLDDQDLDILVKITGEVTPQDVIGYMRNLMAEVDHWAGRKALIEIDGLKPKGFRFSSIHALSQQTKLFEPRINGSHTAVVAPSSIAYGLVRMYLMIRNPPYAMSVFNNRHDALEWLTLNSPH